MILVRTTMTMAVVALVLAMAAPAPAGHDENLRTDWLDYVGTNIVVDDPIGFFAPIPLFTPSGGCDQAGSNGAIFCDALTPDPEDENWTMPDRVHIDVRDSLGPRVGFYWEFRSATGGVIERGFACGSVNTFVPHEDVGPEENGKVWYPNATELRVYPDVVTSTLGRGSSTVLDPIPLGVADTINDARPVDNVTVPEDVPEAGNTTVGIPDLPNQTPSVGIGHDFPCGSPTIGQGTVTVDWRYNAPTFDF